MRAVICEEWGGPETLVVKTIPSPSATANEVLVKIHAAGVNFPDVLTIQKKYQVQPQLPFIPGAEISGVITAVGESVTTLRPGDRVVGLCIYGGFAEEVAIAADKCIKIPDELGYEVAAGFMLAYGTSWYALQHRAALQSGETLLVLGASGGVGLAAVELGRAMGARVVAAASSDEKCAVCLAHGAAAAINYSTEELRAGIRRNCGAGPDVIYDPVGGTFTEAAFRSIGWGGRHLIIGFATGVIPSLPLNLTLLKGAAITGVFWGEYTRRDPASHQRDMAKMFEWIAAGQIAPLISKTYALDETPRALADITARKVTGKILVLPWKS